MDKSNRILKKHIYYKLAILLFIYLASCKNSTISMNEFEKNDFNDLPISVQKVFSGDSEISKELLLIELDCEFTYSLEEVKSGPFTDYYLLVDEIKGINYKIKYGIAFPLIIYQDRLLYSSEEFNVMGTKKAQKSNYKKYKMSSIGR